MHIGSSDITAQTLVKTDCSSCLFLQDVEFTEIMGGVGSMHNCIGIYIFICKMLASYKSECLIGRKI